MDCIVNVTQGWAIGNGGRLQITLHADMRRFRELTRGKTLVLGRATLATFPGGRPLPKRRNIILTTDPTFTVDGGETARSVEEALKLTENDEKVFVIGGASVYRQLLSFCRYAYITRLYVNTPADSFFPDLDANPDWTLVEASERMKSGDVEYALLKYENTALDYI
jgi:dihydrofolate reductase